LQDEPDLGCVLMSKALCELVIALNAINQQGIEQV